MNCWPGSWSLIWGHQSRDWEDTTDWGVQEKVMLHRLDSHGAWLGMWAVHWAGGGPGGVVAPPEYLLSELYFRRSWEAPGSFQWARCPWLWHLTMLLTSSDAYNFENLLFVDPRALAPALTPALPLFLSLITNNPRPYFSPIFPSQKQFCPQMTCVNGYFTFIHQHKSKGFLSINCVIWVE